MIQAWASLPWAGPGAYYGADAAALAARLEAAGVAGVVQGDHLFLPGPPSDDPLARMAADALTVLTTVAAPAKRLAVGTLVANVGFRHPLPLLRSFANLALLHGGRRVYAGLGAGWSRPEFEALGAELPPHDERVRRLAEAVRLARTLFDRGVDDGLPLAPAPPEPPRLLLGGGSPPLLELARRYADHVDLAPPSHRRAASELQRPFLTTVDDLVESAAAVRSGGRPMTTSVLVATVAFCDANAIRNEEEAACARVGLPWRPLADCPYALIGDPERISEQVRERAERIGLDTVILPLAAIDRFAADVLPRLV